MRKVVLYTLMSLDGAVDEPGRYFTPGLAQDHEPEFDAVMESYEKSVIATQDTVLLGRGMYDEWSGYWPNLQDHPFADFINIVEKFVVTSSPLPSPTWRNCTAVAGPVGDVVRDLKTRPGRDIGVHGSIHLAQSMLAGGLVDELRLVVGPAGGFAGSRLFDGAAGVRQLELLSAGSSPTGSLLLHYRVRA